MFIEIAHEWIAREGGELRPDGRLGHDAAQTREQRTFEPARQRNAEALLGAMDYALRDVSGNRLFQENLAGAAGEQSVAAGQRLERLTGDVKPFEKASGLWKTSDFGDAYYHFEAGLAATLARRLELRVTFMDDYKNKPASALLKKNDTAFVLAFVLKT